MEKLTSSSLIEFLISNKNKKFYRIYNFSNPLNPLETSRPYFYTTYFYYNEKTDKNRFFIFEQNASCINRFACNLNGDNRSNGYNINSDCYYLDDSDKNNLKFYILNQKYDIRGRNYCFQTNSISDYTLKIVEFLKGNRYINCYKDVRYKDIEYNEPLFVTTSGYLYITKYNNFWCFVTYNGSIGDFEIINSSIKKDKVFDKPIKVYQDGQLLDIENFFEDEPGKYILSFINIETGEIEKLTLYNFKVNNILSFDEYKKVIKKCKNFCKDKF